MKILIVEDNVKLAGYIKMAFENKSYVVDIAYDGEIGEKKAFYNEYDLIILDIMLPKKDGVSICKNLRKNEIDTPVIMLTAKGELEDKVESLDSGADDYLVKPFEMEELFARVRALIRRPKPKKWEIYNYKDIKIDPVAHRVGLAGKVILLTLKEYSILEYLVLNKGRVITRAEILEHCWNNDYDSFSNIVDVYIKRLRKKLNDKDEKYIKTIRGVGYQLQE